jgi:polysaccharide export outer membrane protein
MNIIRGKQVLFQPGFAALLRGVAGFVALAACCLAPPGAVAEDTLKLDAAFSTAAPPAPTETAADAATVLQLGPGDTVNIQVYGRPELGTTTYVSDDGTIPVPLAGPVQVAGLSPAAASQRVATALRDGQFLVNPQVTIILNQLRSQQVSVLGEVKSPARFPVDSKLSVFDLLAQAGGVTENGADLIYLIRPDKDGHVARYPIDLKGLADGRRSIPVLSLHGGDVVYVPRASQFYIFGEVQAPNMYRLEPGMTVLQAISRSGGITQRGSDSRIEIKRRNADGVYETIRASLTDQLQADDVVRVKERIF